MEKAQLELCIFLFRFVWDWRDELCNITRHLRAFWHAPELIEALHASKEENEDLRTRLDASESAQCLSDRQLMSMTQERAHYKAAFLRVSAQNNCPSSIDLTPIIQKSNYQALYCPNLEVE